MTEKVRIEITKRSKACTPGNATEEDIKFLRLAFGISHRRAVNMLRILNSREETVCRTMTIDITFEQLGRYTALRRQPEDCFGRAGN